MTLDMELLKGRLRETFGEDSQETIAKNLNMTQGNVSKILKGQQQPSLDTIYQASKIYGVSVDWLLGLSEKKTVSKNCQGITYASAFKALKGMVGSGVVVLDEFNKKMSYEIKDPILKMLIEKGNVLSKVDREFYADWIETKLSMFEDKELLLDFAWQDKNVVFLSGDASKESDWLEVYDIAKKVEDDFIENMAYAQDERPFGD